MKQLFKTLTMVVAAYAMVACAADYTPVETFVEADDPVALTAEQQAQWEQVAKPLNGGWGCIDRSYSRSVVPTLPDHETFKVVAWRGERASAQILLWTAEGAQGVECEVAPFKGEGATMPAEVAQTYFVRYTIADEQTYSFKKGGPTVLVPDMLDNLPRFDMEPRTVRPVWVSLEIPADAAAGTYTSTITISHNGRGKIKLPLEVEVQNRTLAPASEWSFHLDLWQHPSAVARAHGLEIWSDEHFEALKPVMQRLAKAGQKVITATLNKDPWNHQCYDGYESMILWTKHKDGSWSYDYKNFDRWVELMLSLGIDKQINCYSMVPWNCELEYFDEKEGKVVTVKAEPGTPIFPVIWEPFLKDFKKHLEAKGWLPFTNIAMDERSPEAMDAAVKVLEKCAPEMGFALADNHQSYKKYTMMRDVCVAMRQKADLADIEMRREIGYTTTFYVCCNPAYPNTFTSSQPYESEMLGWYGIANDYDGMLRWAYNSWPADPQMDSRYGNWMAGDTYLVYPHNRSSIRFERLIDGIEATEKVRTLRKEGADIKALEDMLAKIKTMNANDHSLPWQQTTREVREAMNEVSR